MNIVIKRIAKKPKYTIGKLYIDGEFFCNTLEDTDRGLDSSMSLPEIKAKKVYGETAIPYGTYRIVTNVISPKFKDRTWAKPYGGKLPRLLNVPGFEGVLIHVGNSAEDSLGCILLGKNTVVGKVVDSQTTFKAFMNKIKDQKLITLTICP